MADSIGTCPNCNATLTISVLNLPRFDPTLVSSDTLEKNDPPVESELSHLREFISRGSARMRVLEAKIPLLQASLDKIIQERDELDIEIRRHEGGVSPLRRVPTEILSRIFTFTLPPHQHDTESAPWTVSAVCARWRATVISQSCFWTFIDLRSHRKYRKSTSTFRLETQLRRSGELPLNIDFAASSSSEDRNGKEVKILCKHARRWGVVSFSGSKELYRQLRAFMQDSPALLRELTIRAYDAYTADVQSLDMFKNAPLLQRVAVYETELTWGDNPIPTTFIPMTLPWAQLLYYHGMTTWDRHLRVLRSATNLVTCTLDFHATPPVPHAPILLPHLLRLSLSNPAFLECLETPVLLELYCRYAPPALPFLRRQSCKLQKLVMWLPGPTLLTRIVDAVPTITTLVLAFQLPAEFARNLSGPNLIPCLEFISVSFPKDPVVQNNAMQAIESRWQAGCLKSAKVYCLRWQFAPGVLERMELLRSQGMEIMAEYDNSWSSPLTREVPPELRVQYNDY
ncbi:hypothetical protein B0H19DRAFT_522398 [Mycena capillaripes]|nr:hypothetical protein B0H19DRAFT_522398 [Mycena capillaripes]